MENELYNMKLHDILPINTQSGYYGVLRVPGGWLYQIWDSQMQVNMTVTFVPFNNEFMKDVR